MIARHHRTVRSCVTCAVEAHARHAPAVHTAFAAARLGVAHVRGNETREWTRIKGGRANETKTRANHVTQLERHVHLAIAQRLVQTHKVSQRQPIDEQRNESHLHDFWLVLSAKDTSVPTPKNDD